jgi:WD40 repeat protein
VRDRHEREVVLEAQRGREVTVVRWSPDGRWLVAGLDSGRVVVYRVEDEAGFDVYARVKALAAHTAAVRSVDLTEDAGHMQTSDAAHRLLFWRLHPPPEAAPVGDADGSGGLRAGPEDCGRVRDVVWLGCSSPLGWAVQGVHGPPGQPGDVVTALRVSRDRTELVLGDSGGKVRVFRFPCLVGAGCRTYAGHGPGGVVVGYAPQDRWVLSGGLRDMCLFQWRRGGGSEAQRAVADSDVEAVCGGGLERVVEGLVVRLRLAGADSKEGCTLGGTAGGVMEVLREHMGEASLARTGLFAAHQLASGGVDVCLHIRPGPGGWLQDPTPAQVLATLRGLLASESLRKKVRGAVRMGVSDEVVVVAGEGLAGEDAGGGDDFAVAPPWMGVVAPPADWSDAAGSPALLYPPVTRPGPVQLPAPDRLQLEHVFGGRGRAAHRGVVWLGGGEAVYGAGCAVVVLDPGSARQRFFREHADEVTCLAVHPDGATVASGDAGRRGVVWLWRAPREGDVTVVGDVSGVHECGVAVLAFCGEDRLVTAGRDPEHTVAVWAWGEGGGALLCRRANDGRQILAAAGFSGSYFVTVGLDHVRFWRLDDGHVTCKKPIFGSRGRPQSFLCAAFPFPASPGDSPPMAVTGAMDGSVYVWRGRQLCAVVRAHQGPVLDMCACPAAPAGHAGPSGYLVTGGKDGGVALWRAGGGEPGLSRVLQLCWGAGALEARPASDAPGEPGPAVAGECVRSVAARWVGEGRLGMLVGNGASELRVAEVEASRGAPAGPGGAMHLSSHRVLSRAHGGGTRAVTGLCASGHCSEAYSAGGDGWLRVWDPARCAALAAVAVGEPASAVDCGPVSAQPEQLAVGLCAGGVLLLDLGKLRRLWRRGGPDPALGDVLMDRVGDGRGEVTEVKFSPDGGLVAVGTRTEGVHLYSAAGHGRRGVCRGHLAGVWRIDWSVCGRFLRSAGAAGDLLEWRTDRPGRALALDQALNPPPHRAASSRLARRGARRPA